MVATKRRPWTLAARLKCTRCTRERDRELFIWSNFEPAPSGPLVCLMCQSKAARKKAGMLHKSTRQLEALERVRLSEPERYRRQLEKSGAGYSAEQIALYVSAKFPNQSPTNP